MTLSIVSFLGTRRWGDDREDACRATLVELVNTTGEKTTGDNFGYRMAA